MYGVSCRPKETKLGALPDHATAHRISEVVGQPSRLAVTGSSHVPPACRSVAMAGKGFGIWSFGPSDFFRNFVVFGDETARRARLDAFVYREVSCESIASSLAISMPMLRLVLVQTVLN